MPNYAHLINEPAVLEQTEKGGLQLRSQTLWEKAKKLVLLDRSARGRFEPGEVVRITAVIRDTAPEVVNRGVLFVTVTRISDVAIYT